MPGMARAVPRSAADYFMMSPTDDVTGFRTMTYVRIVEPQRRDNVCGWLLAGRLRRDRIPMMASRALYGKA